MAHMRLTQSLGMLLLGIWLIATGLLPVVAISITGRGCAADQSQPSRLPVG